MLRLNKLSAANCIRSSGSFGVAIEAVALCNVEVTLFQTSLGFFVTDLIQIDLNVIWQLLHFIVVNDICSC